MILGSSSAGYVIAVGRNVRGFKVGDRLAATGCWRRSERHG
ncbi:alcohol dehydrogenase catalytic domain-containing protein [Weissella cibaria]